MDIRAKYWLSIIAVRWVDVTISPGGDFLFQKGDCLVVLGLNDDIHRLERF